MRFKATELCEAMLAEAMLADLRPRGLSQSSRKHQPRYGCGAQETWYLGRQYGMAGGGRGGEGWVGDVGDGGGGVSQLAMMAEGV